MISPLARLVLTSLRPVHRIIHATWSVMLRLRGALLQRLRLPYLLVPTVLPAPRPASGHRRVLGMPVRLAPALAVTVVSALIVVGKPWTSGANGSGEESSAFLSRFHGQTSGIAPSRPAPNLVVDQGGPHETGATFPLGVSVRGPGDGARLVVGGLAKGTTLSTGQPAGDNRWRLSAAELNKVMIQPPRDFVGAMDLTIELHLADDALADRRSLRFEWVAAAVPAAKPNAHAIHPADPEEIAALLKRADRLTSSGDLAAARLVLQRAAEAGDAGAALALARTYDPIVIEKLAVHGFAPNIAMARAWYEKAKALGAADAPRRLEMLASRRD